MDNSIVQFLVEQSVNKRNMEEFWVVTIYFKENILA